MIRKATIADIPGLIALQGQVEKENAIWGYCADSPEDWAQRDLSRTFLAIVETRPIGFIFCSPRPCSGECVFPSGSKILEIVDLIISADERRGGIGHDLVAAARGQAKAEGFTHLRVYSAAKRFDDIVKFYRSCGFTPWFLEMTQEIGAGTGQ